jgi:hypothetical protein
MVSQSLLMTVRSREYWMSYDLAPSQPPLTLPSPVSKLDRRLTKRLWKTTLWRESVGWGRGRSLVLYKSFSTLLQRKYCYHNIKYVEQRRLQYGQVYNYLREDGDFYLHSYYYIQSCKFLLATFDKPKEVIKEQPPSRNLSATARRVLQCTRSQ